MTGTDYKQIEDLAGKIAREMGMTRYDLSCGSHLPEVYLCKYCQKVYKKIDGHWHAFCSGCGAEFSDPNADRAHKCSKRKKQQRIVLLAMLPWGHPKRLPRRKKKAIKKANGGIIPDLTC